MADEVDVSPSDVVSSSDVVLSSDEVESSDDEVPADDDESSEELLAQESIRPKANAKIVGRKSNFSFVIEPKYVPDT